MKKMYILVKDFIPRGLAINSVGHASLMAYLEFKDHPDMQEWLDTSFRKVTCLVNEKEYENAKAVEDCVVVTELALDKAEVALAFRPREDYPKMFRYYRLFN